MSVLETIGVFICIGFLILLSGLLGYAVVGSSANLDLVREQADVTAKSKRLVIVSEEGYSRGFFGAVVHYQFERVPSNGILYKGDFQKRPFTDEIHLHWFKAIDAIKPGTNR